MVEPVQPEQAGGGVDGQLEQLNEMLAKVSAALYGGDLKLEVVDPNRIKRIKKNARYMLKPMFDQLVENIRSDGRLESVPLVHINEDGDYEAISGNHRVEAARTAGLSKILVMLHTSPLDRSRMRAKQLSHNAISGADDKQILAELWQEITELSDKLYAGLDSDLIGELENISFAGFGSEQIRCEQVVMWFLPEEVERVEDLVKACEKLVSVDRTYLAPLSHYEKLHRAITSVKKSQNITNTAVAFMLLIDRLAEAAEDMVADESTDPSAVSGE